MKIDDFISKVEKIFPPGTAMVGDKIGLQLQSGRTEVDKILIAFEVNPDVVAEAVALHADMIFVFHPLIFNPLHQINNNDRVGNLVTQIIQNRIALYVAHTNFDAHILGTSKLFADNLGLTTKSFLVDDSIHSGYGMGVIAEPDEAIGAIELLSRVKKVCKSPIKYNAVGDNTKIKKIAIVGGSGFSFINEVIKCDCDAFITADCSYHKFHEIDGKLLLIDPGHFEMEQFVAAGINSLLGSEFANKIEIIISEINTNPVSYY